MLSLIIESSKANRESLKGNVTVITGTGRGIGYEAARALAWLGAKVVIAEINEANGKSAEQKVNDEFGQQTAFFVKTDIGNQVDIDRLA